MDHCMELLEIRLNLGILLSLNFSYGSWFVLVLINPVYIGIKSRDRRRNL